jgi:hypothetical protein
MYWRIRKHGPLDVVKKYGIHIALVFSLLFNFFLIITRPNLKKKVTMDVSVQLEQFARRVATHILDTSYISYGPSTAALMNPDHGELDPTVVNVLKSQQLLPNSPVELKANIQTYTDQKRVVSIKIDQVTINDAVSVNGTSLIPIDVSGIIAVHSADEAGPPSPFHFQLLVGYRGGNEQAPLVAAFKDLSG